MGYNKERYKNDAEYRKRIIANIRRYQHSEKGKIVCSRVKINFKRDNPNYYKNYMKKKRRDAKKKGICITCFKCAVKEHYFICEECLIRTTARNNERRELKLYKKLE